MSGVDLDGLTVQVSSLNVFEEGRTVASKWSVERALSIIAGMNRSQLKRRIRKFNGSFRMDFSDDYLNSATVDRLRHILFAAMSCQHIRKN
jgi:hypothetical protein